LEDIRRFGYAARKIRVHPKPPPLTKSFTQAVHGRGMANRENQRLSEDWRYEDWMDEDVLFGGDLRKNMISGCSSSVTLDFKVKMKEGATKRGELKVLVLMESREFRIKIALGAEDLTKGSVSRIGMVEGVPIKGDWTFPNPKDSKGARIRANRVAGIITGGNKARRHGRMITKGEFRRKVCVLKSLLISNATAAYSLDINNLSVRMILFVTSASSPVTWVSIARVWATKN
jgi:hypothetical protein